LKVTTLEGTVENGHIKLPISVHLPDKTKVFVVIPGVELNPSAYIGSPRLADPKQIADFEKEVVEENA